MHDDALTVHLAQGGTCDRTLVLCRRSAHARGRLRALSRGRQRDRLSVRNSPESERNECAPAGPGRQDWVRALVESLGRSRRQTMTTDLAAAEPTLGQLAERRAELEQQRATPNAKTDRDRG